MILTTDAAADMVGVSPATIRSWVMRDQLKPIRRGARPLRFHEEDVQAAAYELLDKERHARAVALWRDACSASNDVQR